MNEYINKADLLQIIEPFLTWELLKEINSLAVLRIETPKSCHGCRLKDSGGDCYLLDIADSGETFEEQFEKCPLKEVKK